MREGRRASDYEAYVRRYLQEHAEAAEAYFAWTSAHHSAWDTEDYSAYKHSVAAVAMLPDGVTVEIRL